MKEKTHPRLGRVIRSIILAAIILLALWMLAPLSEALAYSAPLADRLVREPVSVLPAPLAATAPYTTTTTISQISSLHPSGAYMVGYAVEVVVVVTNEGKPGNDNPTGFINVTSNNGGPSCTNLPVTPSGSSVSSATCSLFFTSANNYTISASFLPNSEWLGSSAAPSPIVVVPLSLTASLSAGRLHTCSLSTSGELECWGLGISYPATPQTLISSASAGGYQTCVIKTNGTLGCWGDNSSITANVPNGKFLEISTGKDHVCAINTSHKLDCWGDPESLPLTTTVGLSKPTVEVAAVSAGDTYDCAIRKSDSKLACWGDPDPAWDTGRPTGVVKAVAVGERHACAILSNNQVQCWGVYTALSFGTIQYSQIGSGSDYTCAKRSSNNTLFCSGANKPPISNTEAYAAFSSDFLHTCALTASGTYLDCAGDNSQGQAPRITLTPTSISPYLPKDRPWSQNFNLSGGAPPAVLSLDSGSLPTGILLSGYSLTGTPTNTGLYNFTLKADETFANSSLPYPLKSSKVAFSTTVQNATTSVSVSASPASTPAGSPVTVNVLVSKTASPSLSGSVVISGTTGSAAFEAGCTASVDSAGNAHCVLFFSTAGIKTISAKYSGNNFYFASPESNTTVNIEPVVINPAISAGSSFNCSTNANGALYCWGKNDSNQTIPPVGVFNTVSAGLAHACARTLDGRINCWGWNGYGISAPPASNTFVAVTSGATHACGLVYDGSVVCWGNTLSGRTTVPVGITFMRISAGDDHTCGLDASGYASCWGVSANNRTTPVGGPFSRISSGSTFTCGIQSSDGSLSCWGLVATPSAGTGYKDLDAGAAHVCAIRNNDTLTCWGNNASGQAAPPSGTFSSVSAGSTHTCAIRSDGFMLCWGDNTYNQAPVIQILPTGVPTIDVNVPWSQVLAVSGGREPVPAYAFTASGDMPPGLVVDANSGVISGIPTQPGHFTYHIRAVERNLSPALVQQRTYTQTVRSSVNVIIDSISPAERMVGKPVQVSVSVSETPGSYMGASPTLTVTVNGDSTTTCRLALTAGSGSCFLYFTNSGEKAISASYIGDANFRPGTTATPTAIQVVDFAQQPKVHTGQDRTLIHLADGSLRCMGSGCPSSTQRGPSSMDGIYSAAGVGDAWICVLQTDGQVRCQEDGQIADVYAGQYTALSVGAAHACAIDVYGAITCWGDNSAGQSAPQVGPFITVSAGSNHTCALEIDGSPLCWGSVPGTPPLGTFTSLSAGANHTCSVSASGSISCWGDNAYGQSSPPGGILFQAVSVGDWHTCGLKQDGTLICWGLNTDGQSTAPYGIFDALTSAADQNCALRPGPKLTCWGKSDAGEAPRISITPLNTSAIPALSYWEHGFYPEGGTKPYQASITGGALPRGIYLGVFLSPAGIILYGTPLVPGAYPFVIAWEDSGPIPLVSEIPFSLTITGADLQVKIRPSNPTTAMYMNPFSFEYQITNHTTLAVPDVQLNVTLPEGFGPISTLGLSGCLQTNLLTLECSLSSIAANSVQTLTVTGLVTAPFGQVLTTTAEIHPQLANWPEVSSYDNSDSASVRVAQQFVVFDDPFDTEPLDTGWSAGDVITSSTGITYLGDFANSDQVRLSLKDLPPHRRANVSFDLYIVGTWQGNTAPLGLWEFGEWSQSPLLSTTFCNQESCSQAYPANYPLGSFPWRTGADGLDELGYSGLVDTRYHLSFSLQHSSEVLDLLFSSLNLPTGAFWGLDNVEVTLDWSGINLYLPVIQKITEIPVPSQTQRR